MFSFNSRVPAIASASVMCLLALLMPHAVSSVNATVLSAPISDLPESSGLFYWGDGVHDLYQQWSVYYPDSSGWFYGSTHSWSNADVYVFRGLADPTTITDATVSNYTNLVDWAGEGDTVFFRGTNGFYGAWRIDSIYPLWGGPHPAALSGRWYFQDDGTGCFSGDCAPTPVQATTWGRVKARYAR
jgi:hypothetical protein